MNFDSPITHKPAVMKFKVLAFLPAFFFGQPFGTGGDHYRRWPKRDDRSGRSA